MEYWSKTARNHGYSMIEMLVVLIIIGIIAAVAMKTMNSGTDQRRVEETKQHLDRLAYAISGNPNSISGGVRTDYGYVGDVGALPSSLSNLVTSPGYGTWNGPYFRDEFAANGAGTSANADKDAWGTSLAYSSSGTTITSSGSGSSISRSFAASTDDLLRNSIRLTVTDSNGYLPGWTYKDSVKAVLTIPNGSGGTTNKTKCPGKDGLIKYDSIPIGLHTLKVIYIPDHDTLTRKINVNPGATYTANVQLFRSVWKGSGATSLSEVLRPSGDGNIKELTDHGCSNNDWQCVDEVVPDDDGEYVRSTNNSTKKDTYQMQNHAVGSGTIDSVVVSINARKSANGQTIRTVVRTNGSYYYGTTINLDSYSSYTVFSKNYTTNPNTSSAWTWTQIDAAEAGVEIYESGRCTQVWMTVYYH